MGIRYEEIEEDMQIIKDTLNEISETLLEMKDIFKEALELEKK